MCTFDIAITIEKHLVSWREEGSHLREVTSKVGSKAISRDVSERDVGILNCFPYGHFLIECDSSRFKCMPHQCWVHAKFWRQETLRERGGKHKHCSPKSIHFVYIHYKKKKVIQVEVCTMKINRKHHMTTIFYLYSIIWYYNNFKIQLCNFDNIK